MMRRGDTMLYGNLPPERYFILKRDSDKENPALFLKHKEGYSEPWIGIDWVKHTVLASDLTNGTYARIGDSVEVTEVIPEVPRTTIS